MVAYLTKSEIASASTEIREEFERLFSDNNDFAPQPERKRWAFLRHCFGVLMGEMNSDFSCEARKAANYKCEISQKLSDYYDRTHQPPIRFAFRLQSTRYRLSFPADVEDYPSNNNYFLLVSPTDPAKLTQKERDNVLLRTVDGAIHAEFSALMKLPCRESALTILGEYFDVEGPAYKKILETVEKRLDRSEVLNNPGNPSIKLLKSIKIMWSKIDTARVHTQEYWYLKWWSPSRQTYEPVPYEGPNVQAYTLVKRDGRWLVHSNKYSPPNNRKL